MARTMTVSELREIYPRPEGVAVQKRWRKLDRFMRAFIERSPFLCLGTANAAGIADVSPRGDPPGFVQILDEKTLLIPDRPGNNHLDSIENIIVNPNVGLIFFVPGSEETLRVNGRARVVDDPSLLAAAELNGRAPKVGIEVSIGEVFLHCPKALAFETVGPIAARRPRVLPLPRPLDPRADPRIRGDAGDRGGRSAGRAPPRAHPGLGAAECGASRRCLPNPLPIGNRPGHVAGRQAHARDRPARSQAAAAGG